MDINVEDIRFLDFEASSLGPESWPIEIGIAWIESGRIRSWSSLIRPAPHWGMEGWDEVSARIHGISRATLEGAPTAADVARMAAEILEGRHVVSDSPGFETRWASRLFATIARSAPVFRHFDEVAAASCRGCALDDLYEGLRRLPVPHRAGPDAIRLAKAFLRGTEGNPHAPVLSHR